MISRGSDYSGDHWLWREASLATDVASFLARTGAKLLNDLDANALHIRVIDARSVDARSAGDDERAERGERADRSRSSDDRESDAAPRELYLDTLTAIRRGVVGVTQPARGRHELSGASAQRILSWID